MQSLIVRNVNHALPIALLYFREGADRLITLSPRGTITQEWPAPWATTYERPLERVLFHHVRDANPYFHFFEALWILAGSRDVAWLAFFLKKIADYSDHGVIFHGAYGYRMFTERDDQLQAAIEELQHDPDSRRAVVALWQPDEDVGYKGKDMPCNCTLFFKIRRNRLNLTVANRSNDMVWGAYGANAVQFATILEYVAGKLGVPVGRYVQVSDSFHVYPNEPAYKRLAQLQGLRIEDPYDEDMAKPLQPYPMVWEPATLDQCISDLFDRIGDAIVDQPRTLPLMKYRNPYFHEVATPLFNSFVSYKLKDYDKAVTWAMQCKALDWRLACVDWLWRRQEQRAKEQA
jgi:hypothetical protein